MKTLLFRPVGAGLRGAVSGGLGGEMKSAHSVVLEVPPVSDEPTLGDYQRMISD